MPSDEIEAITESAKALQEAAKLGRDAGGWINRIFGPGIEDAVALHSSDRVRARRIEAAIYDWERLTELLRKVNARLREKGVRSLRLMPTKVVLALIENATVEYEDDLHTLWANLLATGLDARADEIHRQFVSILSDLTSNDAKPLRELHSECGDSGVVWFHLGIDRRLDRSRPELSTSDKISLFNLNRLGLLAPGTIDFRTDEQGTIEAQGPLEEGITILPYPVRAGRAPLI